MSEAQLSALIGGIYDCAVDPAGWRPTLEKVAGFVGGDFCVLISEDAVSAQAHVHFTSRDEDEWLQTYFDKYIYLNPTLVPAMLGLKVGDTMSITTFYRFDEFAQTRFFSEWVRPKGFVDVISALLERSTTSLALLAVLRHERDGPADEAAHRRMKLVAPHVGRAVAIGRLLDLHKLESSALVETLDSLPVWIFLVDVAGRILHANSPARQALGTGQVVLAANGRLVAVDERGKTPLRQALASAAGGDEKIGASGSTVALRSAEGEQFLAHVLPLTSGVRRRAVAVYDVTAAVFVHKAGLDLPSPLAGLAELYGLSPREISVLLAIVEIGGVPAVAATLGLSPKTVKGYLRGIFQKTGARRQADLVKLAAGLANPFAAPGRGLR